MARLGLPKLSFHDLRHSYATYSLAQGIDHKTLQENLGHASAAFTLQEYPHSTMEMKKRSAEKIGTFLSEKLDPPCSAAGDSTEVPIKNENNRRQ